MLGPARLWSSAVVFASTCTAYTIPLPTDAPWSLKTGVSTLDGIRGRSGSPGSPRLDLLHDFHDPATGLCSEGVWHNALLGIALVKASRRIEGEAPDRARDYRAWARRLGRGLRDLNYAPGLGFRRRTRSGAWDAVDDSPAAQEEGPAHFYRPGDDRRCISNAAAVIFWTFLREEFPDDGEVADASAEISETFLDGFFDKARCRFRSVLRSDDADLIGGIRGDAAAGEEVWKSSDHAIAALACLRITRDADLNKRNPGARVAAACAVECLLDDFGYGPYASEGVVPPTNALGEGQPRRNSWHDSLACLAILVSDACSGRESPVGLCRFMSRDYADAWDGGGDGAREGDERRALLLAHDVRGAEQERGSYTCTQAIWDLALRSLDGDIGGTGDFSEGLRLMVEATAVEEEGGVLATVGTAYPMVRLWPNTELAAWLLIEPEDFKL